jgi:molybdopterin-guanine dinucleotide biosynthesis protein A
VLDHTLAALPEAFALIVVGPERPTGRPVTFTREQPAGGGPAAALIAGMRLAVTAQPDAIAVLPGDAPAAGRGAAVLLDALGDSAADSVVATDADGGWQPLQLALRPAAAQQLVDLAGPDGAAGQSVRRLLARLDPPPQPVMLEPAVLFDIDTPDQLLLWRRLAGLDR